ncbi:glycine zipper domain-containing protein [Sulfurovum sp.]|uniref:glycine zipper domain-containing protein n=1 Tax=Sulfurovum sp. TaxID=1969726 RepID=UPI0025FDC3E4|nr:glycine zipper domain-containing protein [Sulfurovum sp.]
MKKLHTVILAAAGASMIALTGCASTGTSKTTDGALIGAAGGALLGQAVGHNTGSTLAGAAIGGLAGAAIGNNEEKKDRRYYRDSRGYTYYVGNDGRRHYQ